MVVTYYIKLFRTGDDRLFYWYVNVSSPSSRRDKNNNNWTFLIFFAFAIMFPLELEIRLYYRFITITTDNLPAQMCCSRTRKWILRIHEGQFIEIWNSITFLIFKTSLAITSHSRTSLWRIAYENRYVTHSLDISIQLH